MAGICAFRISRQVLSGWVVEGLPEVVCKGGCVLMRIRLLAVSVLASLCLFA